MQHKPVICAPKSPPVEFGNNQIKTRYLSGNEICLRRFDQSLFEDLSSSSSTSPAAPICNPSRWDLSG
jgi:hypothetical protein